MNYFGLQKQFKKETIIVQLPIGTGKKTQETSLFGRGYARAPGGCFNNEPTSLRGGSIPREAVDLHKHSLRKLDCQNMEKLCPYFCEQMSKLQTLVITGYRGKTLPEEMGHLASLESLWIVSECLGSLPHSLAKLTRLPGMMLELANGEEIPSGVFKALNRLEYIHLKIDRVTHIPMQEISQLSALEALVLRISHVERLTTQLLSLRLDKLKFFFLESDNMCRLEGVQLICSSLEFLRLCLKKVQVLPPEVITSNLTKLRTLIFWQCISLKELPSQMGGLLLENLVVLDCASLKTLPEGLMRSIEGLVVRDCPALMELPQDLSEEKVHSMKFLCCNEACLTPARVSIPHVVAWKKEIDEHAIQQVDFFMQAVTPITLVSSNRCFF